MAEVAALPILAALHGGNACGTDALLEIRTAQTAEGLAWCSSGGIAD